MNLFHLAKFRSWNPQQQGVSLATPAAQGGYPDAAATSAQFVGEGQDQAGSAHADRVTERDSAAVDIHPVERDAELGDRSESNAGEGFVDLHQVEVGHRECSVATKGILDRVRRL